MPNQARNKGKWKLIKIGKVVVKSALGFFWRDYSMYVANSTQDMLDYKAMGFRDEEFHAMSELEEAFKSSSPFRFISWCQSACVAGGKDGNSPRYTKWTLGGCIVRQGAKQVTFDYTTHKSVIRIK